MSFVTINIFKGEKHSHKPHKRLLIFINSLLTNKIMDLQLFVDKGAVAGHLVVLDQNGIGLPTTVASYQSSDEGIFIVSGDNGGFGLTPVAVGTATFSYTANGISGSATITINPAASVASSIDFVIDTPQP